MDAQRFTKTDLWRPIADKDLQRVEWTVQDVDKAVGYCRERKVALQAGGAFGVWPLRLRALGFEKVITFEPDQDNYKCLVANCHDDPAIQCWNMALGEHFAFAHMERSADRKDNAGAGFVSLDVDGPIVVQNIDEMPIDHLDLLCLDVEGFELFALRGAYDTIMHHRPVIMAEAKELPQMARYGVGKEDALQYLKDVCGYRQVDRRGRDSIMVPNESPAVAVQ
jgi:FkbM family methyltransferase